ncbi:MAG: hypothetical protein IKC81_00350 [Paludibacteraceae bacterium]|nr:hypothetical protein [Paludibacteraceae bacterium]
MLLDKCINLKSIIENEISLHNHGYASKLLNELPIVSGSSLSTYITEIEKYILPQLDYIIYCLQNNKKINERKIIFGHYVVHEWSHSATLGKLLIDIQNSI